MLGCGGGGGALPKMDALLLVSCETQPKLGFVVVRHVGTDLHLAFVFGYLCRLLLGSCSERLLRWENEKQWPKQRRSTIDSL